MEPPLETYSVFRDVEVAPDRPALPNAVTLDEPIHDVVQVPLLEDFEASPETSPLPDAVTLEDLDCAWIDPAEELDIGPDLFMRTSTTKALFRSDEPVRLALGVGVSSLWATCRESGERCLYESVENDSRPDEARTNVFITSFIRCSGCHLECELEASSAWAREFRFESEALPQGVYQVVVDSSEPTARGFIVDDAAVAIVNAWPETCRSLAACRPTQIDISATVEQFTIDADETLEVRLDLEVPFRCPADGVVTDLGWDISDNRISPIVYAVEPGQRSCASNRRPAVIVERTLRIDGGLLAPGSYTIEHNGETIATVLVR